MKSRFTCIRVMARAKYGAPNNCPRFRASPIPPFVKWGHLWVSQILAHLLSLMITADSSSKFDSEVYRILLSSQVQANVSKLIWWCFIPEQGSDPSESNKGMIKNQNQKIPDRPNHSLALNPMCIFICRQKQLAPKRSRSWKWLQYRSGRAIPEKILCTWCCQRVTGAGTGGGGGGIF